MIIIKRFALDRLVLWKNKTDRKPLIINGARQVGKTWLMKEFGKSFYNNVAYISFYNNKKMSDLFETDYDINSIIMNFNIEAGITIDPKDTLIILDEIQNAPKALESLKYFYENAPEYNIIAAGSLLGVSMHEGISYPVGKVDLLYLYPLNFREFLYAIDENELAKALETNDYTVIDTFSEKYLFWLKNYFYVGGMPEAVESFRLEKDYSKVRSIQNNLLLQYKGDFGKHISNKDLPKINMIWDSIPSQLAKENKKFFFGKIKKGARSSEFETAIEWLLDSGLIYKVNKVTEPRVPLSAYKDFSTYKLFMLDIGLLYAKSELDVKTLLDRNEIFVEFKGALSEQYVLQQLISDTPYIPYYYGTDSATFEQDFIIQKEGKIIPIEVKSGDNVKSKSLKLFYDKYNPSLSIRFSTLKYIDQKWMKNIPLYAINNI